MRCIAPTTFAQVPCPPAPQKAANKRDALPEPTLEKRNDKLVDALEAICYKHTPLTNEALLKQSGRQLRKKKALTAETVFAIKFDFAAQLFATE